MYSCSKHVRNETINFPRNTKREKEREKTPKKSYFVFNLITLFVSMLFIYFCVYLVYSLLKENSRN